MKVSVAMITFNHEKYVAQAIQSALDQQADFDYEIVIGEDCSTDRTREIVLDFQKRHPEKIRLLLPERNLGVMKNAVETFHACRGEFIAYLEGDDYWTSPDKLRKQVEYLERHPEYSMCFHNVIKRYEDGSREAHAFYTSEQKEIWTIDDLWELNFIATCSAMLRRGVIGTLPPWFTDLPWGDWALFIFAAQKGDIRYLSDVMGVHRIHSAGMWSGSDTIWRLHKVISFYKVMNRGLRFAYQKKIRARIAEEYLHLVWEYEAQGDLAKARNSAIRCLLADPQGQRVSRRDLYSTIARLQKAIVKQSAPRLYRFLASVRRGRLGGSGAGK